MVMNSPRRVSWLHDLPIEHRRIAERVEDPLLEAEWFTLARDSFHFRAPEGISFFYRMGGPVVIEGAGKENGGIARLYLEGSVFGTIALLHGCVPLHASAVEMEGQAIAFTGPSGAGKSTTTAALAARGMPFFSDDALVLDDSGPMLLAMPGHKRLKLWEDAIALTGARRGGKVVPELEKYFSRPAVQSEAGPLPFTNLFVLCESDDETSFEEVLGSEKLRELTGSLYHPEIYGAISINETHAARLLRMARAVRIWRFRRRRDPAEFPYSTDKLVEFMDGLR